MAQFQSKIWRHRRACFAAWRLLVGNAHPARRLRPFVEGGVLAVVAVLLASTWHVGSFVVVGPSMAETIVGAHRRLTCGDCGHTFRYAADQPEMPGRRAVCPNCGDARRRLDTVASRPADAIVVDRSAFLPRTPHRWELAAFRGSDRASRVYVKRIVGLPGETVELRHGDVYANGAIQRKSLAQLRAMAVPVYDSRYVPDAEASRWLPDADRSGWRKVDSRYQHAANHGKQPATDWLTYHHRRRGPTGIAEECAVLDGIGYNQQSPVTESHRVRDLFVRCRMEIVNSPAMSWSITDGISQFAVELDFARNQARVTQDGRPLGSGGWQATVATSVLFELALCDQQVLLAIDGRPVFSLPYRPAEMPFRPTSRPVAVGARDEVLGLSELSLWRDVYYHPPRGKPPGWQDRLPGDEYFVLGDNSPASQDSRDWPAAGVAAGNLVGKPVLAYPSGYAAGGRRRQFHVPALCDLRYIQ